MSVAQAWIRLEVLPWATWVENPDLSKVDEVGYFDVIPGSGAHTEGLPVERQPPPPVGGWIAVSSFELWGQPVSREVKLRDGETAVVYLAPAAGSSYPLGTLKEVSHMKRGLVLATLILVGSLSAAVMGFQGPPAGQGAPAGPRGGGPGGAPGGPGGGAPGGAPALNTIKVRDNLYMIANAGGNTAVFIMTNGVHSWIPRTRTPDRGFWTRSER